MAKPPKPATDEEQVAPRPDGVREGPATWRSAEDEAETLAALEEYCQSGVSYSVEEAAAELRRLVSERRARKA